MSRDDRKYQNPVKKYFISKLLNKVSEIVIDSNSKNILDIGCGEGYVDEFIFSKIDNINILGIDCDPDLLKIAKKRNLKGQYITGNIYNLKGLKNNFEVVLVMEVLEHLQFPLRAISNINNKFNFVIYTVPNEPWFSILSFFSGSYWKSLGRHPDHVNFWSKNKFKNFLLQVYSNVKIVSSFPWIVAICKK